MLVNHVHDVGDRLWPSLKAQVVGNVHGGLFTVTVHCHHGDVRDGRDGELRTQNGCSQVTVLAGGHCAVAERSSGVTAGERPEVGPHDAAGTG